MTPLQRAILAKDKEMIKLLIVNGADVDKSIVELDLDNANSSLVSEFTTTPLVFAIYYGGKEIAQLLINEGADVNRIIKDNCSVLDRNSFHPNDDITCSTSTLLSQAITFNKTDSHYLSDGFFSDNDKEKINKNKVVDNKQAVEFLIANGANVNLVNDNGDTPLKIAIQNGNKEIIELLKKHGAKE